MEEQHKRATWAHNVLFYIAATRSASDRNRAQARVFFTALLLEAPVYYNESAHQKEFLCHRPDRTDTMSLGLHGLVRCHACFSLKTVLMSPYGPQFKSYLMIIGQMSLSASGCTAEMIGIDPSFAMQAHQFVLACIWSCFPAVCNHQMICI